MAEMTDQNGNLVAKYVQGSAVDEPLAESTLGGTDYYEQDGLGSVTSLTSATGSIAQTYTYDSFGNTTHSTGSLQNPFQYTAREFDSETGLYYYRARYYDPNAGRFLSEDPIRFSGGVDFYAYAGNGPESNTDPWGLAPCGCDKQQRGWRLPDFYSASINIAIPNPLTGTLVGLTFSYEIDRYGHRYFGAGGGVGKSATVVSGSITGNFLNQNCKPNEAQLHNFLTKSSVKGSAGFWSGGQETWTPGSGTATGFGFVSPQIGASYTYSWQTH